MADNPPVRVCFISPKAYPLFNPRAGAAFGGAEVDLYLLATELANDANFKVSFIVADYGQSETETIQNVKVIKSLNFNENLLKGTIKLWDAMRKADAKIYMLKTASPGVPVAAFFCWLHKRAFAYRTASEQECNGEYFKKHFLLGHAFKLSLRSAKFVFTQNIQDKTNLEHTVGIASVFVRNGHPIIPLAERSRDIILWVGRSAPEKQPELFIKLAEQLPCEKFVMICPKALGDRRYEQLVLQAKAVKNLEFIPEVPFHKIGEFFQRAKTFICTSRLEGFPNTYIQASLNAVSIVSLNINPDGFLDKYNCGFCCKGNLKQMADLLRSLLAENKYIELGKNARRYAEQNHDIKKVAEEYKKLFRNLP